MAFQEGEPFNKVYGPFFVYLNSVPNGHDSQALWTNAAQQVLFITSLKFTIDKYTYI